jgi:hypothetical protein
MKKERLRRMDEESKQPDYPYHCRTPDGGVLADVATTLDEELGTSMEDEAIMLVEAVVKSGFVNEVGASAVEEVVVVLEVSPKVQH